MIVGTPSYVKGLQTSTEGGKCISRVAQTLPPLAGHLTLADSDGICNALSEHYLKLRIDGKAFPDDAWELPNAKDLLARQKETADNQRQKSIDLFTSAPYSLKAKTIGDGTPPVGDGGVTVAKLLFKHQSKAGSVYCLISYRSLGHSTPNHICAAVLNGDGSVEYYDPNIGVFLIESEDKLIGWLKTHWSTLNKKYGYVDVTSFS